MILINIPRGSLKHKLKNELFYKADRDVFKDYVEMPYTEAIAGKPYSQESFEMLLYWYVPEKILTWKRVVNIVGLVSLSEFSESWLESIVNECKKRV